MNDKPLLLRNIDRSPLTHDLNAGNSWGLEYPIIYGWRPDRNAWMAWDRHTGEVKHALLPDKNSAGYDSSADKIKKLSEPEGYGDEYIDFDGVS